MRAFSQVYQGRRVLLTGHTGFKGSWLALWLRELGAAVTGIALPPATHPNHWDLLDLDVHSKIVDIRDLEPVLRAVADAAPEIVFHLAAQPLVRHSYANPVETWATNVLGTVHVLEASRRTPGIRAVVVVTSDKCYEPLNPSVPHVEADRLGGRDPYSASKAAAEMAAACYRTSFGSVDGATLVATARAGNVIGGGDWSEDRLIPDLVRAHAAHTPADIRAPNAIRPWQHVLESLSGYLLLGQHLLQGARECATAWNFGPEPAERVTVADLLGRVSAGWPDLQWRIDWAAQPAETLALQLDSSEAYRSLDWRATWDLDQALAATIDWYRTLEQTGAIKTREQLRRYVGDAATKGAVWARG